ncbi:hypothetical protein D039_1148A, partial [Vibrio parahaemolyticus EKP-028]
MSDGR